MVAPHFLADEVDALKRDARRAARARRMGTDSEAAGGALAAHVLASGIVPRGALVAGVWPLPGEIDLRRLMMDLHGRGHGLALPRTPRRGLPLEFRAWGPGEALAEGPMGTRYPAADRVVTPDFVLVPLLAFDRRGFRLGYGGGYYDRTLAALPGVPALGVAFAGQEVERVPVGPHDVALTMIATEVGILRCDATASPR